VNTSNSAMNEENQEMHMYRFGLKNVFFLLCIFSLLVVLSDRKPLFRVLYMGKIHKKLVPDHLADSCNRSNINQRFHAVQVPDFKPSGIQAYWLLTMTYQVVHESYVCSYCELLIMGCCMHSKNYLVTATNFVTNLSEDD